LQAYSQTAYKGLETTWMAPLHNRFSNVKPVSPADNKKIPFVPRPVQQNSHSASCGSTWIVVITDQSAEQTVQGLPAPQISDDNDN